MGSDLLGRVSLVDELGYTFRSADNTRTYPQEVDLTGGAQASSVHGILVDGKPTIVVGDSGGASGVHEHSLCILESQVFVAVGAHVVSFELGAESVSWILKVDEATCFGVHYSQLNDALISHGELEIVRFSRDGGIVWTEGGADIFSEPILLRSDFVEVTDFGGREYQLPYLTEIKPAEQAVPPKSDRAGG